MASDDAPSDGPCQLPREARAHPHLLPIRRASAMFVDVTRSSVDVCPHTLNPPHMHWGPPRFELGLAKHCRIRPRYGVDRPGPWAEFSRSIGHGVRFSAPVGFPRRSIRASHGTASRCAILSSENFDRRSSHVVTRHCQVTSTRLRCRTNDGENYDGKTHKLD